MNRQQRSFIMKIGAALLASFIILMNSFPVIGLAAGNFQPGTFSPGTFSPGQFTPGQFTPGEFHPGQFSPGQFSPGEFTPGDFEPGEFVPGEFIPGEFNPGEFTPGEHTPSNFQTEQTNPENSRIDGIKSGVGPYMGGNPNLTPGLFLPHNIGLIDNVPHGFHNVPPFYGLPNTHLFQFRKTETYNYVNEPWYETSKIIAEDIIMGTIDEFSTTANPNWFNWPNKWRKNTLNQMDWGKVTKNSFIASVGGLITGSDEGSRSAKLLFDVYTGYEHYENVRSWFKSSDVIKNTWNAARTANTVSDGLRDASNVKSGLQSVLSVYKETTKLPDGLTTGLGGKIAPWTAGVSGVLSAGEAVSNFRAGEITDGIANVGEVLMSGSTIAASTGAGVPIAAGMAVAGGVIWAGANIWKHRKAIGRFIKDPIGEGKKAVKAIVDSAAKATKKVKNGVVKVGKKISSWFK